jgi:superfamily II DNA or RNA helicase
MKNIYMTKRFNFLYGAQSKVDIAKRIVDRLDRCLVFTARAEQAEYMCDAYHSKNKKLGNLERFINKDIDKLSVVEMVNMGITIPELKHAVIHQMKSNSEMSLQKVLRMCNLEDDKTAQIYVTVYRNTVDEGWVNSAFSTVNPQKIKRING